MGASTSRLVQDPIHSYGNDILTAFPGFEESVRSMCLMGEIYVSRTSNGELMLTIIDADILFWQQRCLGGPVLVMWGGIAALVPLLQILVLWVLPCPCTAWAVLHLCLQTTCASEHQSTVHRVLKL